MWNGKVDEAWRAISKISTDWGMDEDIPKTGNDKSVDAEKCCDQFGHAEGTCLSEARVQRRLGGRNREGGMQSQEHLGTTDRH